MAHKPTSSVSSVGSDGSFASTISDVFMDTVLGNMGSLHTTAMLTGSAREHLDALSRKDERWIRTPHTIHADIDAAEVLKAMLLCAVGDHATRYAASAILSCKEDVHELVVLANTWVGHFLWPCKYTIFLLKHQGSVDVVVKSNSRGPGSPSSHATPTLDDTASYIGTEMNPNLSRTDAFSEEVSLDPFMCLQISIV
jgi:hypothetical protein